MKRTYSLQRSRICLLLFFLTVRFGFCQSPGDVAFIAFNADGDKDFAIVVLAAIAPNTTLYFTDDETTGDDGFVGSEGVLTWISGPAPIAAGTVVVFTDVDSNSNPNFGVSIGSITRARAFGISSSKDGIIAYTGSSANDPTTYIAAIQIGNDASQLGPFDIDGITLSHTNLEIGATIVVIDGVAHPDGAEYVGSRSDKNTYSAYLESITDASNWTTLSSSGDGESLLPFADDAFTTHQTNWIGAHGSSWNDTTNWSNGLPSSASLASIPKTSTAPIIANGAAAAVGNLIIKAEATLSVAAANALTIHGSAEILGSLNTTSSASLMVRGSVVGYIACTHPISDTHWQLIAAPVVGQDIDAFVAVNDLATGSGRNIGLSEYENSTATWSYYQSGAIGTGNFPSGQGYAIKKSTTENIRFTGTFNLVDVNIPLTKNTNGFNLIGNPYLASVSAAALLNENVALLEEQTIWLWDQTQERYIQKNLTNDIEISPGQGFFVLANTAENFSITEAMQRHASYSFEKGASHTPEISITIDNGAEKRTTTILYFDHATTGWDNGYDSSIFEGIENTFSIYTQTVAHGNDRKLGTQSLPATYDENSMVAIGLIATVDRNLTFSVQVKNVPKRLMVFLEDRLKNTIVRLDESGSAFETSLDADQNGIGRFYLRTSTEDITQTLARDAINLNQAHVFLEENNLLKITGVQSKKARLKIYTILGKTIINLALKSASSMQFKVPKHVQGGIYIVSITTEFGTLNKKIFLN